METDVINQRWYNMKEQLKNKKIFELSFFIVSKAESDREDGPRIESSESQPPPGLPGGSSPP